MRNLRKWIFIVLIVIILIFACTRALLKFQFSYARMWAHSADYDHYAADFHVVKDYILAQFPNEYDKSIYVSSHGGIRLYNPDTGEDLQLPSDVLSALEAIDRSGFPHKDAQLDAIRIHGDRIAFCTHNGQYALVYSPSKKPSWVNSPDETAMPSVKSIGDGWYHVVTRSG